MFIFLDIDGVLNKQSQWNGTSAYPLDDGCITEFCSYVKACGGRIILTSTWRMGFVSSGNPKNTPQIRTLERKLMDRGVKILGTTRDMGSRAREINLFVKKYPNEKYVILDDDDSEYKKLPEALKEHLYLVNAAKGFTRKDTRELISQYGTDVVADDGQVDEASPAARTRFLRRK